MIERAGKRRPTLSELDELTKLIARAAPEQSVASSARTHFIGMNAGTLSKSTLPLLNASGFVFNKVDGIGVLGAMFNPANRSKTSENASSIASNTMLFISRNGTFAIDNVVLPLRNGRVLIDGELCTRKRTLSMTEKNRLEHIDCLLGKEYMDADDDSPDSDHLYELCFAAYDLIVDDDASAANSRNKDSVSVMEPFARFQRLLALTQCSPISDAHNDRAIRTAVTDLNGRPPSVVVFFKMPWLNSTFHLGLRILAPCLRGVPLDGFIFMPGDGPYMVNESNPRLLKYKHWRALTADLVVVKGAGVDQYRFFVVKVGTVLRVISERLWLGDTDNERRITQATLDLEAKRLADGGDPCTPLIMECEPSLDDEAAFFALRDTPFPSEDERLLAAGKLLRWRPTGIIRDDKQYPNAQANFWAIVSALLYPPSIDEIKQQIARRTK